MTKIKKIFKFLTGLIIFVCASIVVFFAYYLSVEKIEKTNYTDTLTVLNVGQAKCTVIKSNDKYAIVDAGQDSNGVDIVSYLEKNKVKDIELLVISHFHTDHTSAVKAILENFNVKTVLIPNLSIENTPATKFFEYLIEKAEKGDINIETASKDAEYVIGNGKIKVLYSTINLTKLSEKNDDERINNTSICLSFTQDNFVFVDTGDAEKYVEKQIIDDIPKNVTVFNLAHHGSSDANTEDFINRLNPKYVTISCGENNKYNHPSDRVIDMFKDKQIPYYITWQNGNIEFSIENNKIIED